MMSEPVLTVSDLSLTLRRGKEESDLVEKVSFNLYPGKTTALVGESGSGKSLTALSLLNLLPDGIEASPESKISFEDQNIIELKGKKLRSIRGKSMAMIFQDPLSALNPVYSIGDQLLEVVNLHLSLFDEEADEKIIEALKEVGIPDPVQMMERYPHELSGGMKQRVMIAMALLCKPQVLIADEPTTALDVTIQAQVLRLIQKLQKEYQMAVLLITHDMGVVAEVADEVIVMYAGEVVESGGVFDIFDRVSHPYTQALFRSLPEGAKPQEPLKAIPGFIPQRGDMPQGCRFNPRCPYAKQECKENHISSYSINNQHEARCILHHNGPKEL